jgi:hypothetical protein
MQEERGQAQLVLNYNIFFEELEKLEFENENYFFKCRA